MLPLIPHLIWLTRHVQALLARHGGRLGGEQLRFWIFVREAGWRVQAILHRIEAGTLRRYPNRRRPVITRARRRPSPNLLPPGRGWMQRLLPELHDGAGNLCHFVERPDMARLIVNVPQLRRALAPLARAFDVRLPRPPQPPPQLPPEPPPEPGGSAPDAPAPPPPAPPPPAPSPPAPSPPAPSPPARRAAPRPPRARPSAHPPPAATAAPAARTRTRVRTGARG